MTSKFFSFLYLYKINVTCFYRLVTALKHSQRAPVRSISEEKEGHCQFMKRTRDHSPRHYLFIFCKNPGAFRPSHDGNCFDHEHFVKMAPESLLNEFILRKECNRDRISQVITFYCHFILGEWWANARLVNFKVFWRIKLVSCNVFESWTGSRRLKGTKIDA